MRLSLSSIAGSIGILLVAIVLSVSCRPDVPDVGPDVGPDVRPDVGPDVGPDIGPDVEPVIPEGAVDMGIVMTREDGSTYKLYWAETNLCESGLCQRPEDLGDYYAWGETQPYYATARILNTRLMHGICSLKKDAMWENIAVPGTTGTPCVLSPKSSFD